MTKIAANASETYDTASMNQHQALLKPAGPILALDLGDKLVGAAVSDEMLVSIKRLAPLKRSNWKKLLRDIVTLIQRYDAQTVVIGLPLRLDGSMGEAAEKARKVATNLSRSIAQPVYLQDERLTSFEAMGNLKTEGHASGEIGALIDGEAAALILRDFIQTDQKRIQVTPSSR
ncbi:MAG TPA: Holliday junction resolvase RuvX [Pyrinomonadaceae bacterium]|nr:Holliday junction resolvase RuvX [Pyrinomonadaceae bacterium]